MLLCGRRFYQIPAAWVMLSVLVLVAAFWYFAEIQETWRHCRANGKPMFAGVPLWDGLSWRGQPGPTQEQEFDKSLTKKDSENLSAFL